MIISGTAHYSKFAYEVLTGLGNVGTSHNPLELFKSLEKLNAKPSLNKNLQHAVKQPVVHKAVCKANVKFIKEAVKNFIKQWLNKSLSVSNISTILYYNWANSFL